MLEHINELTYPYHLRGMLAKAIRQALLFTQDNPTVHAGLSIHLPAQQPQFVVRTRFMAVYVSNLSTRVTHLYQLRPIVHPFVGREIEARTPGPWDVCVVDEGTGVWFPANQAAPEEAMVNYLIPLLPRMLDEFNDAGTQARLKTI